MKKLAIQLIIFYQKYLSPALHRILGIKPGLGCRYLPTCSEYARIHIARDGIIKGLGKATLRILYCQPFVKKLPSYLQQ